MNLFTENPIDRALKRLDHGRRWLKDDYVKNGSMCVGVALHLEPFSEGLIPAEDARALSHHQVFVGTKLAEITDFPVGSWIGWNDNPQTHWRDVEAALKRLSEEWNKEFGEVVLPDRLPEDWAAETEKV